MNQKIKQSYADEPPKWSLLSVLDWSSATRLLTTVPFVHGTQERQSTDSTSD